MVKRIRTIIVLIVLVSLIVSSVQMPAFAQIDPMPFMSKPGVMVPLSPEYAPAYLKGIVIHPENALKFDFIIYKGDKPLTDSQKREEYTKLTKYFLASLAIPDDDQWVNLSPYEKDRIIKDDFGKTEMGRDLLAQDYMLKQITASLIYPEDNLGKEFWNKVYAQAQKQYGTTNIPVNTFNKVWILPDDALIYEKGNTAYILKNHLRVMLEEDYLSLQKHTGIETVIASNNTHTIASKIVKEIVLPELQREVNEDKNFASLRQVYSGMLLATWFKRALKQSLLGRIYVNKDKVKGVDQDQKTNEEIYRRYLQAYKKGVFNFIKEDVDKYTNETIPRKYFSGGTCDYAMANRILGSNILRRTGDRALIARVRAGLSRVDLVSVAMRLMSPVLPARKSSKAAVESFRRLEILSSSRIQDSNLWAFPTDGNYVQTVKELTANHQRPSSPDTLHIGVSGMQNLDIIAVRRSHWGIVIDTSRKVKELYTFIGQTFADDPRIDRRSFKEKLMRLALAPTGALHMDGIGDRMDFEHKVRVLKDVLWFENQRSFEFIKRMFLEKRFICIQGDLVDENLFGRIKAWMEQEHVVLDTLYVSNVAEWLRRSIEIERRDVPWGLLSRFEANIKSIADDETLILDAYQQRAGLYNRLGIYHKGDYAQVSKPSNDAAMAEEFPDPIHPYEWGLRAVDHFYPGARQLASVQEYLLNRGALDPAAKDLFELPGKKYPALVNAKITLISAWLGMRYFNPYYFPRYFLPFHEDLQKRYAAHRSVELLKKEMVNNITFLGLRFYFGLPGQMIEDFLNAKKVPYETTRNFLIRHYFRDVAPEKKAIGTLSQLIDIWEHLDELQDKAMPGVDGNSSTGSMGRAMAKKFDNVQRKKRGNPKRGAFAKLKYRTPEELHEQLESFKIAFFKKIDESNYDKSDSVNDRIEAYKEFVSKLGIPFKEEKINVWSLKSIIAFDKQKGGVFIDAVRGKGPTPFNNLYDLVGSFFMLLFQVSSPYTNLRWDKSKNMNVKISMKYQFYPSIIIPMIISFLIFKSIEFFIIYLFFSLFIKLVIEMVSGAEGHELTHIVQYNVCSQIVKDLGLYYSAPMLKIN